ncbi:unnamed protein product [Symbiodinium necroappetens]|uniref:Transmembrane protein n=1 Tax=Symbiodinium necroappetens TaxID=1628268 RepID=A0A812P8V1_9DINO|nr:unnamed protein product [Symbiodinium necroappetens]
MEPEVVGRKAEERSESEACPAQTNLDRVVDFMSSMETKRPDVLRRTSAWQAIRAVALSDVTAVNADGLYAQSVVTQHIAQFWSHSWHGSKRQKVCTLLLVNNGLAALCAGTCAAVLTAFFLSAAMGQTAEEGSTETTLQGQYHRIYATSRPQAIACNLSGLLVATFLLLLWRPGTSVFLDRVCVHQSDRELKLAGLVSMSAFLKQSQVLTVWWDATYSSRLWCLFELAAYLKSHSGQEARLSVRPVFLGPLAMGIFLGFSFAVLGVMLLPRAGTESGTILTRIALTTAAGSAALWYPLSTLRRFYRSVDMMHAQMRDFRMDSATCYCCSSGHENRMLCDRQIIERCIVEWFGSLESFEQTIQTTVSSALTQQLGKYSFPVSWMWGCSCPVLWTFLAPAIRQPLVGSFFILGWMIAVPVIFMIGASLAYKLRGQRLNHWLDGASTLVCALACVFSYMGMETLASVLSSALQTYWTSVAAFAASMLLIMLSLWCCWQRGSLDRIRMKPQKAPVNNEVKVPPRIESL